MERTISLRAPRGPPQRCVHDPDLETSCGAGIQSLVESFDSYSEPLRGSYGWFSIKVRSLPVSAVSGIKYRFSVFQIKTYFLSL